MTRTEFASVMAYLSAGCGKQMTEQMARVYFDLLGDLPFEAMAIGVKRALLESTFQGLPTPGVLREAATRKPNELLPIEAWELVSNAVSRFGLNGKKAMESLPPRVARAARAIGWTALCGDGKADVLRSQFLKAYEAIDLRDRRDALMAPVLSLANDVAKALPSPETADAGAV